MSRDDVDVVRRAVEEFNAGEIGAGFEAAVHPRIEFRDELGHLDNRDDLIAYFESFQEALDGLHIDLEDIRDLGGTLILVVNQGGHGTGSGAEVEQRFTWVMTLVDGSVVRWRIYADNKQALEESGLSESR